MSWSKPPVDKLTLNVRKNVRDSWESKKSEIEEQIAKGIGADSFTITVNPLEIAAYSSESDLPNLGSYIFSYFNQLVSVVNYQTKDGKDTDAVEVLRKVIPKKSGTIKFVDDDQTRYCGVALESGELNIIVNHKWWGMSIMDLGQRFPESVDKALDALGENDIPIIARRSIAKYIDSDEGLPKWKDQMQKLFDKNFTFEWDYHAIVKPINAKPADEQPGSWDRASENVPMYVASYFTQIISQLEHQKFGTDDMLKEAFLDNTSKHVVKFEIVETLKKGKFHDVVFEDGKLIIQVPPKWFGMSIMDMGRDISDSL